MQVPAPLIVTWFGNPPWALVGGSSGLPLPLRGSERGWQPSWRRGTPSGLSEAALAAQLWPPRAAWYQGLCRSKKMLEFLTPELMTEVDLQKITSVDFRGMTGTLLKVSLPFRAKGCSGHDQTCTVCKGCVVLRQQARSAEDCRAPSQMRQALNLLRIVRRAPWLLKVFQTITFSIV